MSILTDFFILGGIKMTQEKQKMIYAVFCEDTDAISLPAKETDSAFSVNVTEENNIITIDIMIDFTPYSLKIDKTAEAFKLFQNFLQALDYPEKLKEAYFVSDPDAPVYEISVFHKKAKKTENSSTDEAPQDNKSENEQDKVTFVLLIKKSSILKQEVINVSILKETFDKEFIEKLKHLKK